MDIQIDFVPPYELLHCERLHEVRPLQLAAAAGHRELVALLLQRRARPQAAGFMLSEGQWFSLSSPLHLAVAKNHGGVAEVLLQRSDLGPYYYY